MYYKMIFQSYTTFYAVIHHQKKYLEQKNKELLVKIEYIFDKLPERKFKTNVWIVDITCHHLAHALAKCFPDFKAVDGRFNKKRVEPHSRLEEIIREDQQDTPRNAQEYTIIDPYSIAGIKSQMYYGYVGWPQKHLYIPTTPEEKDNCLFDWLSVCSLRNR